MAPELPTVHPVALLLALCLMIAVVGSWVWAILRLRFGKSILPEYTPRIVPWGVVSVFSAIFLWLAVQIIGQIAFVYVTHGSLGRPRGAAESILSPSEMMVASALQNTAVLVVIPLVMALICGARTRDYGLLDPQRNRQVVQGVIAWPLAAPLIYGSMLVAVLIWNKQSHPLETAIQNEGVGRMAPIFFLAGAILAPAAEELIFRGILLGWLTRIVLRSHSPVVVDDLPITLVQEDPDLVLPSLGSSATPGFDLPRDGSNPYAPPQTLSDRPETELAQEAPTPDFAATSRPQVGLGLANVAVSLIFAALHFQVWPTPVPIFFLSLVLGVLYQRTGSLVAPMALHMTFNGVSTVLMLLTLGMGLKDDGVDPPPKAPVPVPAPLPKPVALAPDSLLKGTSECFDEFA